MKTKCYFCGHTKGSHAKNECKICTVKGCNGYANASMKVLK